MLAVVVLAVAAATLATGCGDKKEAEAVPKQLPLHGAVPTPPIPAPEFTLRDYQGRKFGLNQPPGHWVILTFLYTKCPDVCPLIANKLNNVLSVNTAKRANLEVIAVSTDPKNDTPAAVKAYVKAHRLGPRFRYLIGTPKELQAVWRAYRVAALPKRGLISHTAWEILIDPSGKQRVIYPSNTQAADFIVDLALLTGDTGVG
jgi:protein SCO1/2